MTKVSFLDLALVNHELEAELERAALRVLRSGQYLRGAEVESFEREWADYCGATDAVGVGNGLEALQLVLEAMDIGRGDEVLVSAHTSIATWLAISHAGARPVPVEPDPHTLLIDPACIEAGIGSRTSAIVPVHLYGMPADMDRIMKIADRHRLAVVDDASQAHGARLGERMMGTLARATAFSLYPTKNLGAAGDAGIVVSGDAQLLRRVRMLANYGERERHCSELRGYNSRLDELQAALLRVKLTRLDDWNQRRRARAAQYAEALSGIEAITAPGATPDAYAVWHQFVIQTEHRDALRRELARRGVPTLVHYPIPPHRSPAYADEYPEPQPITERLAATVLSLPMSAQLSETTCHHICETLVSSVAAAGMA